MYLCICIDTWSPSSVNISVCSAVAPLFALKVFFKLGLPAPSVADSHDFRPHSGHFRDFSPWGLSCDWHVCFTVVFLMQLPGKPPFLISLAAFSPRLPWESWMLLEKCTLLHVLLPLQIQVLQSPGGPGRLSQAEFPAVSYLLLIFLLPPGFPQCYSLYPTPLPSLSSWLSLHSSGLSIRSLFTRKHSFPREVWVEGPPSCSGSTCMLSHCHLPHYIIVLSFLWCTFGRLYASWSQGPFFTSAKT